MTRETILRNRLQMAEHNLQCCSANYLCTVPREGHEDEYKEAAAEVEILENWLKEFDPWNNPAKCIANLAIAALKVTDESILRMAGGAISDEDKGMYLRAYSSDIRGVIKRLETI